MPTKQTTIEKYPIEKRFIPRSVISAYIGSLISAAILLVPAHIFLFEKLKALIIAADSLVVLWLIFLPFYHYIYYKTFFYDITKEFISIRYGVVGRHEVIINFKKINDVYLTQGWIDRIFGLWNISMATAVDEGTAGAHVEGLNEKNAKAVRDLILSKIKKKGSR